jgi:hypothetical protein
MPEACAKLKIIIILQSQDFFKEEKKKKLLRGGLGAEEQVSLPEETGI